MEDQNQNPKTTETQEETANDNAELEICKKQAEEYLNNWKRERADFVNYKKDEGKRMEEFVKFANGSLILELLDTMDDLYLAAEDLKNEGLGQVLKKFEDLLKKYGVEKIKVGDKFDPMMQEIVATTETPPLHQTGLGVGQAQNESETHKGEEKVEETRAGYMIHGKVIRPARIKIIK